MIDTHCHLTHPKLTGDRPAVLARARESLAACISIGTGIEDAHDVLALADEAAGFVYATAGLDPFTSHRLGAEFDDALEALRDLHEAHPFVAVGEIGLDYHYDLDPAPEQRRKFEAQLALAVDRSRPVVIHVREAHDDMADVLESHPEATGVIHSFTAGPSEAERYLALGWHLAFNGVLTFKSADEVREAAALAPRDRVLLETDSPYLAPVPMRGKRCEPAYVTHVAARLAEVRGTDPATLEAQTDANARALFGLGAG